MSILDIKEFCHNNDFTDIPTDLILDGNVHRFGEKKRRWYVGKIIHNEKGKSLYVFSCGDWREGKILKFQPKHPLSNSDKKTFNIHLDELFEKKRKQEALNRIEAQKNAKKLLDTAIPDISNFPYVVRKKIKGTYNVFLINDIFSSYIAIPMYKDDNLVGLQRIYEDGSKKLLFGQEVKETYHVIGNITENTEVFYMAEGFSTAASIYQATNTPVVICFFANNMSTVTKIFRLKYPKAKIVICGDDDFETKERAGNKAAEEASKITCTAPIFPVFQDRKTKQTDFNDLHIAEGLEVIAQQLSHTEIVDQGFTILGGSKNGYYYFINNYSRMIIRTSSFKIEELLKIANLDYWDSIYSDGKQTDWQRAKSDLIEKSNLIPYYNISRQRGTGVWQDENRFIMNTGKYLFIDGVRVSLSNVKSKYIYIKSDTHINDDILDLKLKNTDRELIQNVVDLLSFKYEHSKYFLLGWLALARVCGALPVRPNIWVTGGRGTGKSTILENFCQPLLGDFSSYKKMTGSGTTEAGLRCSVDSDAIPVIIDEFEVENSDSFKKNNNVLQMIRQAYSGDGGKITKGTQQGGVIEYRLIFSVLLSSIRVSLENDSDKSRFTVIDLEKPNDSKQWQDLKKIIYKIKQDAGERLFSHMFNHLPEVMKSFDILQPLIAEIADQRFGQQQGMLLAGYHVMMCGKAITKEEAENLLNKLKFNELKEEKDTDEIPDEYELLDTILTSLITLNIAGYYSENRVTMTISEFINMPEAIAPLKSYGIYYSKEKGKVYISNTHTGIKDILKGTKWASNWKKSLIRLSRNGKYERVRFGSYAVHNAVGIDYATIFSVNMPEPEPIKKKTKYEEIDNEPLPF